MSNFIVDDLKQVLKGDNPISKIILINVAAFLIYNLFGKFAPLFDWFGLPGDITEFVFKPWTIITYMFLHGGFWHILMNMLWLSWMGKLILEYLGKQRLIAIYFMGGIIGGLTYMLAYSFMSASGNPGMGSGLIGASGGVMAIVIAVSTLLPDYVVQLFLLGRVRMKYVGLGILILTSLLDFSINMGGKLAHLGGAAFGYFFIRQLQAGNDWSLGLTSLTNYLTGLFSKKSRMRVVKKPNRKSNSGSKTSSTFKSPNANDQQRIDAILDKISASGYDALTGEEKEFLFRASNKK